MKKIILLFVALVSLFVFQNNVSAAGSAARSAGGNWVYMYTAEPYAFYRHSKTKKWKMVQVTPTWTHVQNTVVNGWISSMGGGYDYATSFGQRKP